MSQHDRVLLLLPPASLLLLLLPQVRVVCPGVFVAAIGISPPGSLQPVRVCVDSVDRASTVDPWSSSKHQVCVLGLVWVWMC